MKLTDNALRVLEKRYLQRNAVGKLTETPDQMFRRVAENIAKAELNYGKSEIESEEIENAFYKLMTSLDFLPNSPTLMNAGGKLQQLSACFVLEIDDSMGSIFGTLKDAAMIHKSGGGTGFSFTRLRPKNDMVQSTHGISSGPVSFMKVYNAATETIKQGGTRRGANMGILSVDHPDILDFITAKLDTGVLTNFNISVAVTDVFMAALDKGRKYNLLNPRNGKVVDKISAREVFRKLVEMAWATGEPGVVFIDTINKHNPTPHIGKIESTNPCGEVPLLPYESCNLGSINLSNMLKAPKFEKIDWEKLKNTVHLAVRFLDNVIDMNRYPLERIEEITKANRKIGLGVMGFADMLIRLGVPYDSEEAVATAEKVMKFIRDEARVASGELAKERGVFPNYKGSVFDKKLKLKLRNATVTSIAPTGTISIIAGCSSGIEPMYAITYIRNVLDHDKLIEINPLFKALAEREGFYSNNLINEITARSGSVQNVARIPEKVRRLFVTAHDIAPEWHIRLQAAFQRFTDNAVSKTINFPSNATKNDVEQAYKLAYKLGCKGLTVYRDGTRKGQVLSIQGDGLVVTPPIMTEINSESKVYTPAPSQIKMNSGDFTARKGKQKETQKSDKQIKIKPRPRPTQTTGVTEKMKTGCGNLYVTINRDDAGLCEVFTRMGKSGGCASAQSEAVARLVSLALRSGVAPESIVKQLRSIRCPAQVMTTGGMVFSCPDAIAQALEMHLDNPVQRKSILNDSGKAPECPECGGMVEYMEGCIICRECGYTECE
ncbi:vitamin B12-dependent ribonucleotide reductase [[Eubacterium] cellulosolvens]